MKRRDQPTAITTRHLRFGGRVQGVGFRPFVSRSAITWGITGSVRNRGGEVEIIAQGEPEPLQQFLHQLLTHPPPQAQPILLLDEPTVAPRHNQFVILPSHPDECSSVQLPLDLPLCTACLRELTDPADRRYRYPFINCTQCGPRYTLITQLPYDRANTAMGDFPLCGECAHEYRDRHDPRYHAEPIACPACGPTLHYVAGDVRLTGNEGALAAALVALRHGATIAVKGVGGYHLLCDARNETAVVRLRQRKGRPTKPLAVMFPWRGEEGSTALTGEVEVTPHETARLLMPERPIVLCARSRHTTLASSIAPGLAEIGVLLPYSPLHHLLLDQFDGPLVATSANISGEPVLTDNDEVQQRLGNLADGFLHHNRPILHPADDSLYRTIAGTPRPLRLGRGSAPLELTLPCALPRPVVATGGHLKNTVVLAWGKRAVLSPHIGDLGTLRGMQLFAETIATLQRLYQVHAEVVLCDAHPDYASTRWAHSAALPVRRVLHHHAHASALYGEHHGTGEWLVFTWDGSGYGADHTLWGGESFLGTPGRWQRFSSLLPFRLPGGDKAARQPWRSAMALCWESGEEWSQDGIDTALLRHSWQQGLNAPASSAVGRLFDGIAALLGLCHDASYEGEAAMRLEAIAAPGQAYAALPLVRGHEPVWFIDWQPLLPLLLDDKTSSVAHKSGAFHQILADTIVAIALQARMKHAITTVGLTGGVFQNRLLCELASRQLTQRGFTVKLAAQVPCNDGGIAFGQVIEYLNRQEECS